MEPDQKGYTCRFVGGPWDGRDDERARGKWEYSFMELPDVAVAYVPREDLATMCPTKAHKYVRRELSINPEFKRRFLHTDCPPRVSFMAIDSMDDERALHKFLRGSGQLLPQRWVWGD